MVESISECDFFHLTVIWRKAWWEESSEGAEEKVVIFKGLVLTVQSPDFWMKHTLCWSNEMLKECWEDPYVKIWSIKLLFIENRMYNDHNHDSWF